MLLRSATLFFVGLTALAACKPVAQPGSESLDTGVPRGSYLAVVRVKADGCRSPVDLNVPVKLSNTFRHHFSSEFPRLRVDDNAAFGRTLQEFKSWYQARLAISGWLAKELERELAELNKEYSNPQKPGSTEFLELIDQYRCVEAKKRVEAVSIRFMFPGESFPTSICSVRLSGAAAPGDDKACFAIDLNKPIAL